MESEVICYETEHQRDSPDYYKDCQYYPLKVDTALSEPFRYNTQSFMDHFCLPDGEIEGYPNMKKAMRDAFFNTVLGDKGTQYFYDIGECWAVILVASICTVIIAYLYMLLLK